MWLYEEKSRKVKLYFKREEKKKNKEKSERKSVLRFLDIFSFSFGIEQQGKKGGKCERFWSKKPKVSE